MSNPTTHTCPDCGWSWAHGKHGGHSCVAELTGQMRALGDQLAASQAAHQSALELCKAVENEEGFPPAKFALRCLMLVNRVRKYTDNAALKSYVEHAVAARLEAAGQYITNDESREAAIEAALLAPISDEAKRVGLTFCCGKEERLVNEIASLRNVVQSGINANCEAVIEAWNRRFPDAPVERLAQVAEKVSTHVKDRNGRAIFTGDRVRVEWDEDLGICELHLVADGVVRYMSDGIVAAYFVEFDTPIKRGVCEDGIYECDRLMLIQADDEMCICFEVLLCG
jgi:hypothetical protein